MQLTVLQANKKRDLMANRQVQLQKQALKQTHNMTRKQTILNELNDNEYISDNKTSHELTTMLNRQAGKIPRQRHAAMIVPRAYDSSETNEIHYSEQ